MGVKSKLKNIPLLYNINASLKAKQQERCAAEEIKYYNRELIRRRIPFFEGDALSDVLKERLAKRGALRIPRKKGELHIFLAYPLTSWEAVLPKALGIFGKVTVFEWRGRGFNDKSPFWLTERAVMNKAMLSAFNQANENRSVDVVVGYLCGYNTTADTLQKMAEGGSVIFNFCWDDKLFYRGKKINGQWFGPAALASVVDLNLTNAPDCRIKYFLDNGLSMFWPEAAHPAVHKPYNISFEFDVSFIGGKYGWRQKFISKLRKLGVDVTCFGDGWENGPLSDEEMVKLYSRSRINLGFAGVGHSKKLMCLKGRDFEVPMSGGLYLTQDNPELSLIYDVGREIVTYRDERDCAEKIKWLLSSPSEADKIRKAGRMKVLREHTWEKRFEKIFRMAGILN